MDVKKNYLSLVEEVRNLAPDREIKIVCVSKGVDVDKILAVIEAGAKIIGENRVQEARKKYEYIKGKVEFHMIGHLQTNKVKYAVKMFDMIQSLDSVKLAKEIDKRAKAINKVQKTLVEVNTSGEESKYGILPSQLPLLLEEIEKLNNIQVLGLMTVGPLTDDENKIRSSFATLRKLRDEYRKKFGGNIFLEELSMGMTDDYRIAIEEGSTMIRVGRKIFGERKY